MAPEAAAALLLSPESDTAEIMALSSSAGYRIVRTFTQRLQSPDPKFYMGEGKVRQVARFIERCARGEGTAARGGDEDEEEGAEDAADDSAAGCAEKPQLAIFNGNLRPTQVFHLEKALGVSVFDRIRLILEIFTKRANSPEARLQVELARLQYDVPLVREYIHRTRTGEHPGLFFAGGAYQVDEYYQMIKSRMVKIRRELERIGKERSQRRKTRRRGGLALLSLAGYTNAGKSALFRALTSDEAAVGDELFTTLSTTTRKLRFPVQGSRVLLTDTVGFIRNLPPWLVEAFMSTLEEVFLSDAIILVVDLSDEPDEILSKLDTTLGILKRGERQIPIIAAFNKTDLLGAQEAERRIAGILGTNNMPQSCGISAVTGEGLPELVRLTLSALPDFFFGSISGPADELLALVGHNIRPDVVPSAGPASASAVLLRNWQAQEFGREHEKLLFKKSPGPEGRIHQREAEGI
jgi:GTP-binding protein HflX